MPGTCVIGLQWGDEAKGKIVDLLTQEHDIVVRYQGGANAGHTVVVGEEVYKLSLLPSGVLTAGVTCVIAGGVVLNPAKAIEELDELASRNVEDSDNLKISDRVHVIFPWHFAEDRVMDQKYVRWREHRYHRPWHRALLSRQSGPFVCHSSRRYVPRYFS